MSRRPPPRDGPPKKRSAKPGRQRSDRTGWDRPGDRSTTGKRGSDGPRRPRRGRSSDGSRSTKGGQRRALSQHGGVRRHEGDPAWVQILERALSAAEAESPDRFTHRFHPWPARMHPSLVREVLASVDDRGPVLDPFCGSGTTLIEARLAGRRAVGVDLNPIAAPLCALKTAVFSRDELATLRRAGADVCERASDRVRAKERVRAPIPDALVGRWDPHVLGALASLWVEIDALDDDAVRRPLLLVLSAILTKFSRRRSETQSREAARRIGRFVPVDFFERKLEELCDQLQRYARAVGPGTEEPLVVEGDARKLPQFLPQRRFSLAVSSPPYGGTYDYRDQHELRHPWLGLDDRAFGERELGARRRLTAATDGQAQWDAELTAFLRSLAAVLDDEGHAVLFLGDADVGRGKEKTRVAADHQLRRLGPSVGLPVVAVASERRRDWSGGAPREEHLVVLRRDVRTKNRKKSPRAPEKGPSPDAEADRARGGRGRATLTRAPQPKSKA